MAELLSVAFLGLVVGSIYALTAFGLVLTYRTSGVFNFAHGAVGMFFAHVFFQLTQGGRLNLVVSVYDQRWSLPAPVALVVVVGVLAPMVGWALDVALFRRLRPAGSLVKIVATIGLLVALQGVVGVVWVESALTPRSIFPEAILSVGGFRATLEELATVAIAVGLCAALLVFLRTSPLGVRMRAVVDRPELAELVGVDSARVSAVAWAIGSGFAALAGILLVPFFGSLDPLSLTLLVVVAAAAAVVGRLESLPLTLAGGFGIAVAQFLVQHYTSTEVARQLQPAIPFLVLFLVLMLPVRFREISEGRAPPAGSPPPARDGRARAAKALLVGAALVLPAVVLSPDWQFDLATVPPMALLFLSLVLLSGYAGQISLSQASFAGFGAFVAAHLVAGQGWPFLAAAAVGGLAAVPLGGLIAARAARLPPLFLGFATLAFGAVMDQVAFTSPSFSGGLAGIFFERPSFLQSPRAYYLFGLAVFGAFAVLVTNLRRGRTGLALAAMRDSPAGLASVGVSTARLQFVAFCLSAFMAGVAGAMLAAATEAATPFSYFSLQSLVILALAVIGGIGRWTGALVGAALFQLAAPFLHQPFVLESFVGRVIFHGQLEALLPVFFGLGAIGLARNPSGIVEQVREGVAAVAARIERMRGQEVRREAAHEPAARPSPDGRLVSFAHAGLYHRDSCVLTAGKEPALVGAAAAGGRSPCPVCHPENGAGRAAVRP